MYVYVYIYTFMHIYVLCIYIHSIYLVCVYIHVIDYGKCVCSYVYKYLQAFIVHVFMYI